MDEKVVIYTENPEEEMWKTISMFTYRDYIKNFYTTNNIVVESGELENLCDRVSSSIVQAKEYFELAKSASINTSPLLLYYGSVNLIYGCLMLKKGKFFDVKNHGMRTEPSERLSDSIVHFTDKNNGGINVFLKELCGNVNLLEQNDWTIKELLLSIPEINNEALRCYGTEETYCLPIYSYEDENGLTEKLFFKKTSVEKVEEFISLASQIKEHYIRPRLDIKEEEIEVILKRKFLHNPYLLKTFYNQSFFELGHLKSGKSIVLPQWALIIILLYSLSCLCRYHSDVWQPFLKTNETGEVLLVDRFLSHSRRRFPNIILSLIIGSDYKFENTKYESERHINNLDEHKVKEIINKELQKKKPL